MNIIIMVYSVLLKLFIACKIHNWKNQMIHPLFSLLFVETILNIVGNPRLVSILFTGSFRR